MDDWRASPFGRILADDGESSAERERQQSHSEARPLDSTAGAGLEDLEAVALLDKAVLARMAEQFPPLLEMSSTSVVGRMVKIKQLLPGATPD